MLEPLYRVVIKLEIAFPIIIKNVSKDLELRSRDNLVECVRVCVRVSQSGLFYGTESPLLSVIL